MKLRSEPTATLARATVTAVLFLLASGTLCAQHSSASITLGIAPQAVKQAAQLIVTLKPVFASAAGTTDAIEVTVRAEQMNVEAGKPLLSLPTVISNVQTAAHSIESLTATDAAGPLVLTAHDLPAAESSAESRVWSASRAVGGAVEWRYRAPITNAPNPRGAAPPLELRSEDGAFSAQAGTFLLLPASDAGYLLNLHWDFAGLPSGAVGMSSLGVGDLHPNRILPPEDIREIYVFGGNLHRFPEQPTAKGFFSAWQGNPPFDAKSLMAWTEQLYEYYFDFFRPEKVEPYAVLMRRNLINPGGGVELGNAFIGTFDKKADVAEFKMTLAHEMVHTFARGLDSGMELDGSWYSEGLAVYYERLLPLRAGRITPSDFLKDLNSTAARYYTNALLHTPNNEIAAQFWTETRVRVLPYDRGSLYFALLDSQLRHASGGKRSLDTLVSAMLTRRRHGQPMDEAAWRVLLLQELGKPGPDQLDAMLRGDLILPPSEAFGPCFNRTTKLLLRYELGFEAKVLTEPTRTVRGLVPGSNADEAGLRNGDHIVRPVPQDAIQGDQNALLQLELEREGKRLSLSYLPRGESIEAYQWERVPGVADASCSLPADDDFVR